MTTRVPALQHPSPLSPAFEVLRHARRVVIIVNHSLDGDIAAASYGRAHQTFWRHHDSASGWRTPVRTREARASQWARHHAVLEAGRRPGFAHYAVARLQSSLPDCEIVTGATDVLLERAGASRIHHLHGQVAADHCDPSRMAGSRDAGIRRQCALPAAVWHRARQSLARCDAMLLLTGTDLVYPCAEFVHHGLAHGARLVQASRLPTGIDALAHVNLRAAPTDVAAVLADSLADRRAA